MLERIHHIGVVVSDLAQAERLFGEVLGLPLVRTLDIPGRPDRSLWYACGAVLIELIDVIDAEARARRLGDDPARIEHVAFSVDGLDGVVGALGAAGIRFRETLRIDTTLNAWTEPSTSGGVMLQLVDEATGRAAYSGDDRERRG